MKAFRASMILGPVGLVTGVLALSSSAGADNGPTLSATLLGAFQRGCSLEGPATTDALQSISTLQSALESLDSTSADSPECRAAMQRLRSGLVTRSAGTRSGPSSGGGPGSGPDGSAAVDAMQLGMDQAARQRAVEELQAQINELEADLTAERAKPPRPAPAGDAGPATEDSGSGDDTFRDEARITRIQANIATLRDQLRQSQRAAERAAWDARNDLILQVHAVSTGAAAALTACRNKPDVLASLVSPIMGIVTEATGPMGGIAAAAITGVADIVSAIVQIFTADHSARDAIDALDQSRLPVALFCTMERLSNRFCETQDSVDRLLRLSRGSEEGCSRDPIFHAFTTLGDVPSVVDQVSRAINPGEGAYISESLSPSYYNIERIANYVDHVKDEIRTQIASLPAGDTRRAALNGRRLQTQEISERLHSTMTAITDFQRVATDDATTATGLREAQTRLQAAFTATGYFDARTRGGRLMNDFNSVIGFHRELLTPRWRSAATVCARGDLDRLQDLSVTVSLGQWNRATAWTQYTVANNRNVDALRSMGTYLNGSMERAIENTYNQVESLRSSNPTMSHSRFVDLVKLCEAAISLPTLSDSIRTRCGNVPLDGAGPRNAGGRRFRDIQNQSFEERACFLYQRSRLGLPAPTTIPTPPPAAP